MKLSILPYWAVEGYASPTTTHVISIGDPNQQLLPVLPSNPAILRLEFLDISDECWRGLDGRILADDNHMQALIDFVREMPAEADVTIHCTAAVSRSPAAAYIMLNVLWGAGREQAAMDTVHQARPGCNPNQLMIAIADRLLGRDGVMLRVAQEDHLKRA